MQLLCIAALLLSAVAARRGDGGQSVTQAPRDGDGGSGGDAGHPVWTHEMPPWFSNGPPRRPGNDRQPGRTTQVPGVMSGAPHLGRPRGPSRGSRCHNRTNPASMVFSPIFKVGNVTFQNVTGVTLKEGENIFLMPKHGGQGHHHRHHRHRRHHHHHHTGGKHGPPQDVQYVKLIYNATQPNEVSIEYGVLKHSNATSTNNSLLMKLGEILGVEDEPEEDYY